MYSSAVIWVKGGAPYLLLQHQQKQLFSTLSRKKTPLWFSPPSTTPRNFSARSSLQPLDVSRLAETARISLTPTEVEEFAPKIRQVIDWFGQLQAVDLQSIEPALRADTEGDNLRHDLPETFENREAMLAAVPSYEEPYIKVPKVLNKD
ncbi:Aspartyl/glutamyl-tRNA(Asn/Gln) amidotransferase [Macleaya cordata]|uniref:Glutamyl-tRNA(Gln) amidotransferase subunit C, chloroplastic/mitochondrial n=1 Tax=Macleaya cordata TaxID=56857 RepID=A0A200QVG7_MACCD|nr:Aspartyl/glutamyl-tRNA(Asn/Gln) amidotransferase [Macleaya cordata]